MKRAWILLLACTSRDIVATSQGPTEQPAYCTGKGPPILVGDGVTVGESDGNPDDVCSGEVAVRTFARALCTCEGYTTSTSLDTDSFDSAAGVYAPGGTTGDVGIDAALQANARLGIGGSLVTGGATSVQVDLTVAHDLFVGGTLGTNVAVACGGDAHLASDVNLASLQVAGTLSIPPSATITGTVTAGATQRVPVTIEPPCGCGANDLVDIPAFVAGHTTDNQNAAIGLAVDRLAHYAADATLDLPCGIYYQSSIAGDGALTLRVTGRVALLVGGDITLTHPFTIELATDDAELDLMTSGLLSSNNPIMVGRNDHPSRTRIYVGGSGTIQLSGGSEIAANIYAPKAAVALSAPATIFGSLFVRRLDQAAPVSIHYDVNVRRADVGCFQ